MIEPVLKDDAFLADVAAARAQNDYLHLWCLGQSGFLVLWQNQHLLLDPCLPDSLAERVVDPARLNFIDIVTSSDRDSETIASLLRVSPALKLVIPEASRMRVCASLKLSSSRPLGLDAGDSITLGAFEIHGVPAAHENIELDERDRCRFLGYVVKAGPWTLYYSGDTARYEGMVEGLKHFDIDIALLFSNARVDGVKLAKEIGARLVIPCHNAISEIVNSPESLRAEAECQGQACNVMSPGERWSGKKDNGAR